MRLITKLAPQARQAHNATKLEKVSGIRQNAPNYQARAASARQTHNATKRVFF